MAVQPEDLQVIIYEDGGAKRIIRGTPSKVNAVVVPIVQAAPTVQAFVMDETDLNTAATFADPRTPTSAADFASRYPDRNYQIP